MTAVEVMSIAAGAAGAGTLLSCVPDALKRRRSQWVETATHKQPLSSVLEVAISRGLLRWLERMAAAPSPKDREGTQEERLSKLTDKYGSMSMADYAEKERVRGLVDSVLGTDADVREP